MLSDLYARSPVALQNAFATAYGVRELGRRHTGRFSREVSGLEARQWWTPERLAVDRDSRLRAMLTWAAARIPHYRELFAELALDPLDIRTAADLTALPLLDKETVRAAPERFLPDPPLRRLVPQTTGGTTGTPLRYWATRAAVQFNYATYEARTRRWAGVDFGDRMASFHGQPIVAAGDEDGPLWRHNLAFNQLYCSVYHLSDANLGRYVDALSRFDPRVLAGYTSAIHRLAQWVLATGDVGRIRPAAILVSSETLLAAARHDIEAAFGCRVTNSYSLGELVAYVSECDAGELHISTEYGVVELVDSGAGSEIVATTLINRAMPLLRYRTGDLATGADPRPSLCGRGLPVVASITGRVDDVVHTPEGTTVGPAPMSLAFQRVPNLRRAQVHQSDVASLDILLETAPNWGDDDAELLRTELRRRLGPSIDLRFERTSTLPRTSGGKERLIVSTLRRPDPPASGDREQP